MATKSTPDGVDLKLSNYSTTAAIASANNATLATVAANYGLKTVVDQHSLDIAARITPLEVDTKVANALLGAVTAAALASELASRDASISGLQASKADASALTAYALQSAVDTSSEVDSKIAAALLNGGPGRRPPRQGGRQRAGLPALHGGRTGHATGGRHPNSKCAAGPCHQGLRRSAARPTRRCWPHTPRTPRSPPARPRSRAPSTQSSRSSPPCSFPEAELLTRRPGRASQLGSSFTEAASFATCTSWLLSLLRWPTATTR